LATTCRANAGSPHSRRTSLRPSRASLPDVDGFVLAMNDAGRRHAYPPRVRFEIAEGDLGSYQRAADFLWIFGPEAPYEREGDVGYVTFPCGYTLGADGDAINLYYGAADTSVMATGSVGQLLRWLDQHGAP
jgi:hypothetical protein